MNIHMNMYLGSSQCAKEFFIMLDFCSENVVYLRSLFLMYSMGILTNHLVFLPGAGLGFS